MFIKARKMNPPFLLRGSLTRSNFLQADCTSICSQIHDWNIFPSRQIQVETTLNKRRTSMLKRLSILLSKLKTDVASTVCLNIENNVENELCSRRWKQVVTLTFHLNTLGMVELISNTRNHPISLGRFFYGNTKTDIDSSCIFTYLLKVLLLI